ncbi:hypothetical protein CRE_29424 [Caenorhabditis remanei]|uniref:Domain of unknown function WSN domain-containing protein n=1 Tax=Caenorhabditis remanei TaxID=31234 RepID=E3LUX4_CAERE|nr:hypothetical protein CRE_29424 [Caenorhabditis remanei]
MIRLIPFVVWIGAIFVNGHPSGNLTRFSRATDAEFTTSLKQMQMLARITNGIYLQQGMIKGTIPPADLVSEILNLGTAKLSDIDKIKTENLKEMASKIEQVPGKLKTDKNVETIEERLVVLNSIVKTSNGVESLEKLGDDYKTEVKKLEALKTDWVTLETYAGYLQNFLVESAKLEGDIARGKIRPTFGTIASALDIFKTGNLEAYKTVTTTASLENYKPKFSSLSNFHDSVELFVDKNIKFEASDTAKMTTISGHASALASMITDVQSSKVEFELLKQILLQRTHQNTHKIFAHTSGFPNGFSDISTINADLDDKWIQKIVGGNAENLKSSFKSLGTIGNLSQIVDETIGKTSDGLDALLETLPRIAQLSSETMSGLASNLAGIQSTVQVDSITPKNYEDYKVLHGAIRSVFDQLSAIDKVIGVCEQLASPEYTGKLESVIKIITLDNDDQGPERLVQLKGDKNYQDLLTLVKSVEDSSKVLSAAVTLVDDAKTIDGKFGELNTYVDGSNKFLDMLKSLKNVESLGSVESFVKVRRSVGGMNADDIKKLSTVAGNIENAKSKLKELETAINKMKGFKSAGTDVLISLNDAKKDSDTLGSATRGIASMQQMTKDPVDMKQLIHAVGTIDSERKTSRVTLSAEEKKSLDELRRLERDINTLKSSIGQYISSVTASKSDKLSDHSDIFDKAASVNGISTDFKTAIVSIEKLANDPSSSAPDLLRKDVPIWEKLDSIGLDFAKYQTDFQSAKKSLSSLEATFAKFHGSSVVATSSSSNSSESESDDNPSWGAFGRNLGIITGIIVALLVIGIGGGMTFLHLKRKREMKRKGKTRGIEEGGGGKKSKGKKSKGKSTGATEKTGGDTETTGTPTTTNDTMSKSVTIQEEPKSKMKKTEKSKKKGDKKKKGTK